MMLVFVGVVVVVSYDMHKLNDEETTSQSLALDRFVGGATGCSWKKKEEGHKRSKTAQRRRTYGTVMLHS